MHGQQNIKTVLHVSAYCTSYSGSFTPKVRTY